MKMDLLINSLYYCDLPFCVSKTQQCHKRPKPNTKYILETNAQTKRPLELLTSLQSVQTEENSFRIDRYL